jgi:hypothetical protein
MGFAGDLLQPSCRDAADNNKQGARNPNANKRVAEFERNPAKSNLRNFDAFKLLKDFIHNFHFHASISALVSYVNMTPSE